MRSPVFTKEMKMRFVRAAVERMSAYVPGEKAAGADYLILNANENLYPPAPQVIKAMQAALATVQWYPESTSAGVRAAAAAAYEAHGVQPEQVLVTNSSDEMLRILNQSCAGEGDVICAFTPSFTFYKTLAAVQGADFREIEFPEDYSLPDLSQYPELKKAKLVFFPNPAAPSGTVYELSDIRKLIEAAPQALVVIDEAYADFDRNAHTALPLLKEYPNLVITRTLSKSYSLAGLRVGLGFASAQVISELNKVRDYYNLDMIAQAGAEAALLAKDDLAEKCEKIIATREWFARELQVLQPLVQKVWPSGTNFVLARFAQPGAETIYNILKEKRILVRYWKKPRLDDCLRISIGTDDMMRKVINELRCIAND